MRIFVMVDMEGISGVVRAEQVSPGGVHYESARRYATADVNACVRGCIDGGARDVLVRDAHSGRGFNLVWEELDEGARYIQGDPATRMPGIKRCDGLILLGYHAMAGTPGAILEHTMSSGHWQNFAMNGRLCGELAIDAGIAGDHGVPTIMASGDDKLCREARSFIKGIVAVEVKKGLGVDAGVLLPPARARQRIREGAAKAVDRCREMKPFTVSHPVRMRLELVSRGKIPCNRPGVKVIDGRTYEVRGESVEAALNLLV